MPEMEDLYEMLHLHPSAHPDVIQAAYRRLALLYHPDKNPSPEANEMMAAVNRAYAVLSDPEQRAEYDRSRAVQSGSTGSSASAASSSQASRPQSNAPQNPTGYFTLGSTKSDVADIHGPPSDVSIDQYFRAEVWHYGSDDTIEFDVNSGKVQGWSNIRRNLRIKLVPGPNVTSLDYFTIGAHRDELARLHGTPVMIMASQELDREIWVYDGPEVIAAIEFSFSTGRVNHWESDDRNLKARQQDPSQSASNPGAYTGRTSSTSRASNWRTIRGEGVIAIRTDDHVYPEYSLTVMLGESGIGVFVNWGTQVSYSDAVTILFRVDDGPGWQQSWVASTDGTATFLPAPESNEMLQMLLDSQTFSVMPDTIIGSSLFAQFDTHGIREAIAPLLNEWNRRRNSPSSSSYSYQSSTGNTPSGSSQPNRTPNYGSTASGSAHSSGRPTSSASSRSSRHDSGGIPPSSSYSSRPTTSDSPSSNSGTTSRPKLGVRDTFRRWVKYDVCLPFFRWLKNGVWDRLRQ